jgi:hypothetical protein
VSAEAWQRRLDPAYRLGRVRAHGYSGYSNGCRCETCRAAKADYMARRRADAYVTDSTPEADPDITHGTRSAYEERGCRCAQCCANQETCSRYARGRVA